ncbi:MAG: terpene cyclase/mutase family protein [Planctomycetes bacterium]|nr:terpene cyclase/mutase family protein [Planctomycetota bacterium]
MHYEMNRPSFEGESFNEVLVEQLRRTPWLLISGAIHGLIIMVLMLFARTDELVAEPTMAEMRLDQPLPEELMEDVEEPPEDEPEPDDTTEDVVDFSQEVDDRNEDATNEPFEDFCSADESFDCNTDLDAWSDNDAIGVGCGASSASGGRRGGRHRHRRGAPKAERVVDQSLEWLAIHQSRDGSWDSDGFMNQGDPRRGPLCDGKGNALYDVGVSGLALLCFLGAGETHTVGDHKTTVRNALRWLRDQQDAEGCFGSRTLSNFTYNHAIATLAMAEAYAMTKSPLLGKSTEQAVAFALRCQNPYQAWRYGEATGENDSSVTGWMVMALKAARSAGIQIDDRPFEWSLNFIDEMTDEETGRTGYTKRGEPPVREVGMQTEFPSSESESLTAVAITSRIFAGEDPKESRMIRLGVENLLTKKLPVWDPARGSIDMYYWYYATLAMYQYGGDSWAKWNRAMNDAIITKQRSDGNFAGSWDPKGPWGEAGGRVYSTALMTLCLEVYYRYARVFGVK